MGLTNNFNNPIATANYYDNRNETYQVLSNFYAQLNLIPDKLNIRSSYSYDYSMIRGSEFTPTYYVGTNQKKEVTELTKKNTNYYNGYGTTLPPTPTSGASTPLPACWALPCAKSNTACSKVLPPTYPKVQTYGNTSHWATRKALR